MSVVLLVPKLHLGMPAPLRTGTAGSVLFLIATDPTSGAERPTERLTLSEKCNFQELSGSQVQLGNEEQVPATSPLAGWLARFTL